MLEVVWVGVVVGCKEVLFIFGDVLECCYVVV